MGIPGLDPKVRKDYPEGVRQYRDGEKVPGEVVTVVGKDANPFAHNAWRNVFELMREGGEFDASLRGLNKEEIEELIFQDMWHNMMIDLERIRPERGGGFLIYFDGAAPKAKQTQQRERRFGSGMDIVKKVFGAEKSEENTAIIRDIILEQLSEGSYTSPIDLPGEWKEAWKDFVEEEGVTHFNSNKITPGTPFSRRLSEWMVRKLDYEIHKYDNQPLRRELYENGNGDSSSSSTSSSSKTKMKGTPPLFLKSLFIGFSDSSLPGEGEHKIMDFIRRGCNFRKEYEDGNMTYLHVPPAYENSPQPPVNSFCISGPDGDLLMLMFCAIPYIVRTAKKGKSNKPIRIYLYKRDHFTPGVWRIYDAIKILKSIYTELIVRPKITLQEGKGMNKIIADFIYIGFSVGNDFVPKLKMFYTLNDGLNTILDILKRDVYNSRGTPSGKTSRETSRLLCDKVKINKKITYIPNRSQTQILFNSLAQLEEQEIASQYFVNQRLAEEDDPLTDYTLLSCFSSPPPSSEELGDYFDWDMYRTKYYTKVIENRELGNDESLSLEDVIKDMCFRYLSSLGWILQYYLTGIPSWDWHYGYSHAPLISDLSAYISSEVGADVSWTNLHTFTPSEPSSPLKAALSVLPHVSSYLLRGDGMSGVDVFNFYSQHPLRDNPIFINFDYEGVGKEYKKIAYVNDVELEGV